MADLDAIDLENYETGPFCRHWGDPSDCAILCAVCGHKCTRHECEDGRRECLEDDCDCERWTEAEELAEEAING